MRVAVTQFATTSDIQQNLATCVRVINEAAACKPSLIVLPEFCNAPSWFDDHNHAWNSALTTAGKFFQCIGEQAKKHDCYIVINVTLRRDPARDHQDGAVKSNISVTTCLFSPSAALILQADKQSLMGHENDFFIRASQAADLATTPFGKVGLFSGDDGITFETSRDLALRGAQLLCAGLHSFALDQASLHLRARASENKVFLAAANKVGPLLGQQPIAAIAEQGLIPERYLNGVGESQIISPDGIVLAKASSNEEGFVFADIELDDSKYKKRPDGSDIFGQRRPELYQQIAQAPKNEVCNNAPASANLAIFATYKTNEQAIEDVCHYIENNLTDIIQLPELFFIADKEIAKDGEQNAQLACLSKKLIEQISAQLRPFQYVCTSLVIEGAHQAVLISEAGLFATQKQLHFCQRYQWTALGDELNIITLALEQGSIKIAMLTADDANIPEIVKVAALHGIHLLLVPFDIQEACEVQYSLVSRAAENRICLLGACREKSFAPAPSANTGNQKRVKAEKLSGLVANLQTDFTLFTPWQSRKFDGNINLPRVKRQGGKITKAVIHPVAASNKRMAEKTDLLKDRPWFINAKLTRSVD